MPYFMRKEEAGFCIYKGTTDDPQERVKCHDSEEDASEHLAALRINVEAEEKYLAQPFHDIVQDYYDLVVDKRETVSREETIKAEWSAAFVNDLPDSSFLHVESGGKKDSEGKTTPRSLRHLPIKDASGKVDLPHLRNAISRLGQPKTGTGGDGNWLTEDLRKRLLKKAQSMLSSAGGGDGKDEGKGDGKSKFVVFKAADGHHRWMAVSSTAVLDKENEVVSEKAYDDAIAWARQNTYGELDLVHIDGTDVGNCDMMVRLGNQLVESGDMFDTDVALRVIKAVGANPDRYGISIKFAFDPMQFDGQTYLGNIRILKRTILPKEMAASHGTAISIASLGGEHMGTLDEKAIEVLREFAFTDEEIAALAESQKSVADPPNVKEKAEDAPVEDAPLTSEEGKGLLATLKKFVSSISDKQPKEQEPAAERTVEVAQADTPVFELDEKAAASIAEVVIPAVVEKVAEQLMSALAPVGPALEAIPAFGKRLDEVEKTIARISEPIEEQVATKLSELPPVVKVTATTLQATRKDQETVPETVPSTEPKTYTSELFAQLKKSISDALGSVESKYTV